jgi:hypothetical protein
VQVDVFLYNKGLNLFVEGDKKFLEEGFLMPTKKIKNEKLCKRGHPP